MFVCCSCSVYFDLTYRTFVYFLQIGMPPDEQGLSLPSPDRLSNLKIYLIDDILSRLSFRDVVRVITLSKDWQYICWRIPHVKFDQTVWKTPEHLTSPTIGFIPILESFLRFHRGIILKVTLNITSLIVCPDVDRLIFSLDIDHIQHFVLEIPFTYPPFRLPNFFFIVQHWGISISWDVKYNFHVSLRDLISWLG